MDAIGEDLVGITHHPKLCCRVACGLIADTCPPPLSPLGPDEESRMENEELLSLKRELAEKAASKQLDSYGYYLYV